MTALAVSESGRLAAAMSSGIYVRESAAGKFELQEPRTDAHRWDIGTVETLAFDEDNKLWAGTRAGLFRENEETWRRYGNLHGYGEVTDILPCGDGVVWVATENGLYRLEQGKFRSFSAPDWLPHDHIYDITLAPKEDVLWVATHGGIARIEGQTRAK